MPKLRSRLFLLAAFVGFAFSMSASQAHSEPSPGGKAQRLLDVDAMLKIASVGDPAVLGWRGYEKDLYHASPDGRRIAIVVQSGDPAKDARKGQIFLFDTAAILDKTERPKPELVAEFSSRTNSQPIAGLKWENDHSLIFAATDGDALIQVYRLDLTSKRLIQITRETRPISAFASKENEGVLVVTEAEPPIRPADDPECLRRGCRITARRFSDALSGAGDKGTYPGNLAFYDRIGVRHQLTSLYSRDDIKDCWPNDFIPGGLSPDGRYALFFCTLKKWPGWWSEYTVDSRFSRMLSKGNTNYAKQYFLLDVAKNSIRPLNSAPFVLFAPIDGPLWIDGGKHLLLVGAVEPLDRVSGAERKTRAGRLGVVQVDPATGATEFEFPLDHTKFRSITKASWDQKRQLLTAEAVFQDGTTAPVMEWRRTGKSWARVEHITAEPTVQLHLVQSPNARPVLYASRTEGDRGREIFDPNPWLDNFKLGKVEEIHWKSSGGHDWDGEIYYPPAYKSGNRYPLVILTHGVNPGTFSPSGYARNYAAQPLAAKGMIVLQMDEKGLTDVSVSPAEMPRSQEGIESAIDEMDRRHLIDRTRVGLVGWSRTSWYLNYMATHSDYPLRALMITDGADSGWWTYISGGITQEMDVDLGAAPFGRGLESMLEVAATFNLDRWRAPLLMWSAGDDFLLWDLYSGLRRLNDPVEYWDFPDGAHDLFKMSHLRVGNSLMVDWFDFWLNGHEDPDPAKRDQYQRWQKLRDKERLRMVEPRPPLLDWTAVDRSSAK